ncbi:agmatinase [bacterium]|nr:agmatinase [bacterium]
MIELARFIASNSSEKGAKIILFGIPYDATSSFRSMSRNGMKMVRLISEDAIEEFSFAQKSGLEDVPFFDAGDMELMVGDPTVMIQKVGDELVKPLFENRIAVAVGGEHLVSLPLIKHALKNAPNLTVLQLDAHADLRLAYAGQSLSHASVMKLSLDAGVKKLVQLGIRSGDKDEFEMRKNDKRIIPANSIQEAVDSLEEGGQIYLTVDIDYFDPSVVPGTGTPESGGAKFSDFIALITLLKKKKVRFVGADITELAPELDSSGRSTVFAAQILRELLIGINETFNR